MTDVQTLLTRDAAMMENMDPQGRKWDTLGARQHPGMLVVAAFVRNANGEYVPDGKINAPIERKEVKDPVTGATKFKAGRYNCTGEFTHKLRALSEVKKFLAVQWDENDAAVQKAERGRLAAAERRNKEKKVDAADTSG